ncbi:MAG: hypothetical protein J6R59_13220, partial [Paludibacteraceae bacterium]|nr:hypothetical protein [Paludibacteraceae bacterium]MBO5829394.1 hypothetical protein [Paludibacteraceae bacterium]
MGTITHIYLAINTIDNWHCLTQQGDLYSEVVKDTHIPRDAIKPTFQSFFSIKNETSYIYGGK